MPDVDDRSISQLTTAPDITADTLVEVATPDQSSASGYSSYKEVLSTIFDKILNTFSFTQRLNTNNKTVFGAINELQSGGGGGSSTLAGLSDVAISSLANRQMLKYNSTTGKWENFSLYIPEEFTVYDIDQTGDTYYINEMFEVFNEPTKAIYLVKEPNTMPVWFQYVGTTVANSRWEVNYARVYKNNTTGRYNMELATLTENEDPAITDVVFSSTEFASYIELEMEAIAGMTFVIFRNAAITTNSTIEVFTDPPELQRSVPIQIENGACTVTFPALTQTTMIKVRIS